MLSFFPRGVLDEILNLIESVSEDFPSYSGIKGVRKISQKVVPLHSWLVGCLGINGHLRNISVYFGPSPREREKEKRGDR